MSPRSAIVVGAGIGGLTAAMKLAHQGVAVQLFEKQAIPGGRCARLEAGGFRWDLGPTILLMPFVLEAAFAAVGRKLSDYLTLHRCDPNYRLRWRDGTQLTLTSELTRMRAELERLEPGSFERYLRFLAKGQARHDVSLEHFVGKHFDTLAEFLTPANLPRIFEVGAHRKLYGQVSKAFKDPKLREAMSFQTMYLGVSPYEAPAVFSLLPYTELAVGVWYPMGGMGEIAYALDRVCREEGVTLRYQAPVERILVEGGRAVGVRLLDGTEQRAEVVVCNADYVWAQKHLLDAPPRALAALEKRRFTASGYMLYWGLRRRVEGLLQHNIFFGADFRGSFTDIFDRLQVPGDVSFYVNAAAQLDPSVAPPGQEALYVLVPVPHRSPQVDWKVEGPKVRAQVLARLAQEGFPGLEQDLVVERIVTPDDWESDLNLERGSNFGLAQNMFQIGPFRPKVWDDRVENLFYCGCSVQPGTGVPTVMISADLMLEAIARRARPGQVLPAARPLAAAPAPGGTAA